MSLFEQDPLLQQQPYYYLRHIQTLIDYVIVHQAHLLSEVERQQCQDFAKLTTMQQALLTRLLLRQGEYFVIHKLQYPEIDQIDQQVQTLIDKHWLAHAAPEDAATLLKLFTKAEWLTIAPHLLAALKAGKKSDWLPTFQLHLVELRTRVSPLVVQHTLLPWLESLQLAFFANRYQQLNEFVIQELAIRQYAPYHIQSTMHRFKNRDELDAYRLYKHWAEQCETLERSQWLELLPQLEPHIESSKFQRQWHKLLYRAIYQQERIDPAAALPNYQRLQLPQARERSLRIIEKTGSKEEIRSALKEYTALAQTASERLTCYQVHRRLQKQLDDLPTLPPPPSPRAKTYQCLPHREGVEQALCRLLRDKGWACFHTENALISGIWGLVHWSVIFAEVDGAFVQPFQVAPLDWGEPDFLQLREQQLQACKIRWQQSTASQRCRWVLEAFNQHWGQLNPCVHWQRLPRQAIQMALCFIDAEQWSSLFEYLESDLKAHRSGQPDLFVCNGKSAGFIEVKGPGDQIQAHQRYWWQALVDVQIEAHIAKVEYLPTA